MIALLPESATYPGIRPPIRARLRRRAHLCGAHVVSNYAPLRQARPPRIQTRLDALGSHARRRIQAFLTTFLVLVGLSAPVLAQTPVPAAQVTAAQPSRAILMMADFGDQEQFDIENQAVGLLWDCLASGNLAQVQGLAPRPTVVNTSQADGQKVLQRLGLADTLVPVLAVADLDAGGQPRNLLWHRKVFQPAVDVRAMLAYFGVDPEAGQPLIRSAVFQPQGLGRPLRAGEVVTVTVQGRPAATVTATIGGRVGLPCFEEPAGLYRATYTVSAEDRTDAQVSVDVRTPEGLEEHRDLGSVALQGVMTTEIQLFQQVGPSQWMATGMAAPGSKVVVYAEVVQSALMFRDVQKQQLQGVADSSGRFQALGNLQGNLDGAQGTFRVEATDPSGALARSEERQIRLVADGRWQPQPPPQPQPWQPGPGWGVQAFSDSTGLYVVSRGMRSQIETMSPRWYQAVADVVVYSSFMNDLKVWWQGQTYRLESMAPKSWKADTGTVAYVNFMGNFLVWHRGQNTNLGSLPPQSYEIGPGALAFVGANRGFFLWQPGSGVRQLESWPPRDYRIYGHTLQYTDSGGFQRTVNF